MIKGKFTGPLIAAGGAAMFVTQSMEALFDSTNKFNQAIKNNDLEKLNVLTAASNTSGAGMGVAASNNLVLVV